VKNESAADLGVRGAVDSRGLTLSPCSCRHAADPWLTNKDGKQDAKEDDDEHEAEQHVSPIEAEDGAPGKPGGWIRDIQP